MRRLFIASIALCLSAVAGLAGLLMIVLHGSAPDTARAQRAALELSEVEHKFLYDDWNKQIQTDNFWRGRRSNSAPAMQPPSRLQGPPTGNTWFVAPPGQSWNADPNGVGSRFPGSTTRGGSGYRTVCVRTCDGFFFPISFSTSEARFGRDQATCSSACPGARLFYYRSSSQDPEDMVDMNGQSYSKMANANLFRTQYVENCKCRPHPWEQEAVDRHRIYALEQQRQKGNRAVVAELTELRSKQQAESSTRYDSRRARERSKRRPSSDDQTSIPPQMGPASVPAPRSDASRGQGERTWTDASVSVAPSSTITAASPAPAIENTRTASVASRRHTMVDVPAVAHSSQVVAASQPTVSSSSTTRSAAVSASMQEAAAVVAPSMSATATDDPKPEALAATAGRVSIGAASPGGAASDTPSDQVAPAAVAPAEAQSPAPQVAASAATKSRSRKSSARRSPGAVAARPTGMMQLGATHQVAARAPARPAAWRPADAGWASRVFGM